MAKIKTLKDYNDEIIYPQSTTRAIVDSNGINLDTLHSKFVMMDQITEIEDIDNPIDLSNYYDKTTADEKFASKEKYSDTTINVGRKADTTVGDFSIATGTNSTATGYASSAQNLQTTSYGTGAHAEGAYTIANNNFSHAEGYSTIAFAEGSHAEGAGTRADAPYSHVQGKYNIIDSDEEYIHIVGNGSSDDARSNAHTIKSTGEAWFQGPIYVGSTSGTHKDEGSVKLIAENDINNILNTLGNSKIILDYIVPSDCASLELTDIELISGKKYEIIVKPTGPAYACSSSTNKMTLDGVQIYSASNLGDSPSAYSAWFILHADATNGIIYSNKSNPISHTFTCNENKHVFNWTASGTYNSYTRTIINANSRILILEV